MRLHSLTTLYAATKRAHARDLELRPSVYCLLCQNVRCTQYPTSLSVINRFTTPKPSGDDNTISYRPDRTIASAHLLNTKQIINNGTTVVSTS